MGKRAIPGALITAIVGDLTLVEEGTHAWIWEVHLANDMLIYYPEKGEAAYVPAGSVFYLPMGQLDEVRRLAMAEASAATEGIAARSHNQAVFADKVLEEIPPPPF